MAPRDAPPPRPPALPAVIAWFGAWAGVGGILGFLVGDDLGFSEEVPAYILASLVAGGGLAGWILYKPVRGAVAQRRRILAALLGIAAALVALELGVTFAILALGDSDLVSALPVAWLFAPLLGLPVLLIARPGSGVALVAAARYVDSRRSGGGS